MSDALSLAVHAITQHFGITEGFYYRVEVWVGVYADTALVFSPGRHACGHPVRGFPGERCGLKPDHRGHHSCSVGYCNGCGTVRASQLQRVRIGGYGEDAEYDTYCWYCLNVRPQDDYEYA